MYSMRDELTEVVYTEKKIAARVEELGFQITDDFKDKVKDGIVAITVLRGAITFSTDLCRCIDLPMEADFMQLSSYGDGHKSSGSVKIKKDVSSSITGKHVLVIEDIYDTGNSMQFLVNFLASKNPESISTAVLLRKDVENQIPFDIDYLAFHCPNEFIVGYGLDYAQKYRNLPYIGILKPEIYLS